MSLPTSISLAMIIKNERKNLPRLFESVKDCFTEIHITDTGSTDGSIEWLEKNGAEIAGCPVFVHHFEWVDSFGKARNYSFSHVKTEYVMWLDADDVLKNKEAFIQFRDHAMKYVDMWFATYHYAIDKDGSPVVSFVIKRIFRKSLDPQWKYDLHEGIIAKPEWSKNYITTWAVNHLRDAEDIAQDKSRNINILEKMKDVDTRMLFYYGKELYEAQRPFEAIPVLIKASEKSDIEPHDKLLCFQYAAYASMQAASDLKPELAEQKLKYYNEAISYAQTGVKFDSNRAEFYVAIGDCLLQTNRLRDSIPYFAAAKACINPRSNGSPYEGAIYSFLNCYGELPSLQLSKIYLHLGMLDKSIEEASSCVEKYKNEEAKLVLAEAKRVTEITALDNNQEEVPDIVFSCPPQSAYEFDEELYKTKGMGGSETALIEMAKNLHKLTKRPVKVFNMRKDDLVAESGVEYISNSKMVEFLNKKKPSAHIAWRHNIKVTKAPTYLWAHDLITATTESQHNFDKMLCLSPFHKEYTNGLMGVPKEKISLTRNGLNPEKFKFNYKPKNPNKIVWMSSPDRGLDRCMQVMDEAIKHLPDLELHVYYGIEGLYKYGPQMSALADHLKKMMADRPYVHYHGNTEQNKMYQDVSDAVIWLHPNNFIETFCITAIEMLSLGIFPITRRYGALMDTLKDAEQKGQAVLLDFDCITEAEISAYAKELIEAIKEKKWERIDFDIEKHSWESVAHEWVQEMGL